MRKICLLLKAFSLSENCVANVNLNAVKLQYLWGYHTDYALKIISHLTVSKQNYDIAIYLLKEEFLDNEFIVNEILKQTDETKHLFKFEFVRVKQYLTKVRSQLLELKNSFI